MCGKTTMTLLLFTAVFLCVLFVPASAIRCYECDSTVSGCDDPFRYYSSLKTCSHGTHCVKGIAVVSGITGIVRECSPENPGVDNECATVSFDSFQGKACFCNTDFCNAAHKLSMSTYITMTLLTGLLLSQYNMVW